MSTPTDSPTAEAGASFAEMFGEAYGKLCAVAAACVTDRVEAEDLVQDAALVGLRKFGDFRPGTSFVAWMSQIV
ncbi:MAG: sigma factor, partial [Planctomycetota bacterium]